MDTTIYTPRQIADRWYICYQTVLRMIHEGELRAFRVGHEWRVTAEALNEYETRPHTQQPQKKQKFTRIN